ncbi:MAG: PilW family protein [Thiobacillaceae bacterium]
MNRAHPLHSARQRGLSLVELMVALTIGLILLIALAYFFLGSRQLSRSHDDVSRMQESGRYALEILGKAIRQAGYRADADVAFGGVALTGTDGADTATPDTITVQYDPQDGLEASCTGTNVVSPARVTYAFAVNGSRELTCGGSVVADNIENMQITYGIDIGKDGIIDSYTATPTAAQFLQAAAVRVNLVVRGPTANAATGGDGFLRQTYSATFAVRNQAF